MTISISFVSEREVDSSKDLQNPYEYGTLKHKGETHRAAHKVREEQSLLREQHYT